MNASDAVHDQAIRRFRDMQRAPGRLAALRAQARWLLECLRREFTVGLSDALAYDSERLRGASALVWVDHHCHLGNAQVHSFYPFVRRDSPFTITLVVNCLGLSVPRDCLRRLGWSHWPAYPEPQTRPSVAVHCTPEELLALVPWVARRVSLQHEDPLTDFPFRWCEHDWQREARRYVWTEATRDEHDAYQRTLAAERNGAA